MNLKTLALAVGVLGAAAVTVHFVTRPEAPAPADTRLGQPVLTPAVADKASGLRVRQGSASVELRKRADGTWTVASYHDLDADFSRLAQLTESLANAKWLRYVTSSPERLKRMDLGSTQVEFLDDKGSAYWTLQVGKDFEGGGRFARLGDETKAFVASLSLWVDTDSKNWADSALLKTKPEEVKELKVSFAEGADLVLTRESPDKDFKTAALPEGRVLKKSQVTSAVSSLANIRFSQTYAPDEPKMIEASAHSRTFSLTTFAGETLTLTLAQAPATPAPSPVPAAPGATPTPPPPPAPENPVFVKVQSSRPDSPLAAAMSKRAFEVYAYLLSNLPKTRDAWFEAAPTPSPSPTPATSAAPAGNATK